MLRRAVLLLLILSCLVPVFGNRVAGLRIGFEGYSFEETDGGRLSLGVEFLLGGGENLIELSYGINRLFNTLDRLAVGFAHSHVLARDHSLRAGVSFAMNYPYTRDWYSWEDRINHAWWEYSLTGDWHWEFIPGLAALVGVRASFGSDEGRLALALGGRVGIIVYP